MKTLNVLAAILLIASFGVQADKNSKLPFKYIDEGPFETGTIQTISRTTITFDDLKYTLSPTVKYSTIDKERATASVLKKGDDVALTLIRINNRIYVDHIYKMYIPKRPLK